MLAGSMICINLVYDPAFLVHAFERVAENKGARTAGVDGVTVARIETRVGVDVFLPDGITAVRGENRCRAHRRGFDFLGFHIRRMQKRGTNKQYVYTKPSRKSTSNIRDRVRKKTYRSTLNNDLDELLTSLNQTLRGWANYFRHGTAKATFSAVDSHTWWRLAGWIRRKHRLTSRKQLRRRFCDRGWRIAHNGVVFTGASSVKVKRYRYRGANIPTPWTPAPTG